MDCWSVFLRVFLLPPSPTLLTYTHFSFFPLSSCVCLLVFAFFGYFAYEFFKDARVGGGKFLGAIAVGGSLLACGGGMMRNGYSIPEILGGRMAGGM